MRWVAKIFAWMTVAIGVAGCNVLEGQYFRQGIGTDLSSGDIVSATELQNVYLDHLCRQTLPFVGAGVRSCSNEQIPPQAWPLIVQAGMNDIDQRCDAYLAWLDQKKRENAAVLTEISAIRVAVDAITNPSITHGVGPRTLAAIAAAFGFATDTLSNINSLLLTADHTTVQTVVFTNRHDFRESAAKLQIDNKPMAVHTLRSYLTICMPMTISAKINSTVTVFQQMGAGAVNARPLVAPPTRTSSVIVNPTRPLPAPPPPPPPRDDAFNSTERAMYVLPRDIPNIQAALCVSGENGLGPHKSRTRLAIRDYLLGRQLFSEVKATDESVTITDRMRSMLNEAVDEVGDCFKPEFGFKNPYEVGRYGIPRRQRSAKIRDTQRRLKLFFSSQRAITVSLPDETGVFDEKTRKAIAEFRRLKPDLGSSPRPEELDLAIQAEIQNVR
jgi:hypothetical protein